MHSIRRLLISAAALVLFAPLASTSAQSPAAAREDYANLPGVRIWYRDTGGNGPSVVLLHATTGSSRVWEYQLPVFTENGFRVIVYDRRGFGRSAGS